MKFPWQRSEKPITGAVLRPVRIAPGEAKMIREMTDLSTRLYRDVADLNGKMVRSYDAAITNGYNTDFKGTYGNANAEIFTQHYKIRARTRTLAKDTPHGKAIVRTYQNNVIGHDPFALTVRYGKRIAKPHAKTGQNVEVFEPDRELNRKIEGEWRKFCKPANFTIRKTISYMEALRQVEAESITIGSILIRIWRGYPGNKYKFALDLLEADRLQETFHGVAEGTGNPIRASVEYDKTWNYPVAYWILRRHPGEFIQTTFPGPGSPNNQNFRERVPAEDIIHYNNLRDRAEQDWGFTELDAAVQSMHHNFQYARALTLASVASCCKPFVIEKDFPTGLQYQATPEELASMMNNNGTPAGAEAIGSDNQINNLDPVKGQWGNAAMNQGMSPAMTQVMEWGFKMKVLDPRFPIEAAHEFRNDNLKDVATATGISYSALTGDFQSLGYIAAQMSKQPERDHFMVHQKNIIENVLERVFSEWLTFANMHGILDIPEDIFEDVCDAAFFKSKRWPFTDMLREVQALILKLDAGLISPQQAQDEMPDGISFEDLVAQRAEAQECLEAHGLPSLAFDPTQVKAEEAVPPSGDDEGNTAPAKLGKPKGSMTAKGQKTETTRGVRPHIQRIIDEVDYKNGLPH